MNNPYQPWLATIKNITEEVQGGRAIKTFRLQLIDETVRKNFHFQPGQCVMVSLFGVGECMFAISSSPTKQDYLEVSVLRHGKVTQALHESQVGDTVGIRGPYGNSFDIQNWQGKQLVFIGGGIGQAPLRSVINYVLDNRDLYADITIIYGARSTHELCFKSELFALQSRKDITVALSIDQPEKDWNGFVGFVPDNLLQVHPSPVNAIAITCGPPIMIDNAIKNLLSLGFSPDQIFTTLEMRMKCGIGKCGRCNIGSLYVCKDGPIFSYAQLQCIQGER